MRRNPLFFLASNWISLLGVVLVTTGGLLWLFLLPSYWRGGPSNPYLGILVFLALPAVFFSGLALIPAGIYLYARRRRKAGDTGPLMPRGFELRRLAQFVIATTILNLVIGTQLTYSAVTYMDTQSFCGQACHKVMNPEYTAYLHSPHSRVECVECHIGPGVGWLVKAKVNGMHQLAGVVFNTYHRPIPTPVAQLRPARDTCENCHSRDRDYGNRLVVRAGFADDETNTPSTTVLTMKVGGRTRAGAVGIHGAHVNEKASIEYIATDIRRETIPEVTYTAEDGKVTVYRDTGSKATQDQLARGEHRRMDCLDCHNRPAHTFELPERAVNNAMSRGTISPVLPFVKKEAVAALRKQYPDQEAAMQGIASYLSSVYQSKSPAVDPATLKSAIETVQVIYSRNVFPEMKITWGTYPNHLGHTDTPGCFRCHDGNHTSAAGKTIPNDCSTCHELVATEEKNPKILTELGIGKSGN